MISLERDLHFTLKPMLQELSEAKSLIHAQQQEIDELREMVSKGRERGRGGRGLWLEMRGAAGL